MLKRTHQYKIQQANCLSYPVAYHDKAQSMIPQHPPTPTPTFFTMKGYIFVSEECAAFAGWPFHRSKRTLHFFGRAKFKCQFMQ